MPRQQNELDVYARDVRQKQQTVDRLTSRYDDLSQQLSALNAELTAARQALAQAWASLQLRVLDP